MGGDGPLDNQGPAREICRNPRGSRRAQVTLRPDRHQNRRAFLDASKRPVEENPVARLELGFSVSSVR